MAGGGTKKTSRKKKRGKGAVVKKDTNKKTRQDMIKGKALGGYKPKASAIGKAAPKKGGKGAAPKKGGKGARLREI